MKPYIDDLNTLKIKRVTDFKVLFTYDNKDYLLINHDDLDNNLSMYYRERVRDNRYILNLIGSVHNLSVRDIIIDTSKKPVKNITYSNINLDYFINELTRVNLVDSDSNNIIHNHLNSIKKLRNEIAKLEDEIGKIEKEYKDNRHFTKKQFRNIKDTQAERVKPAKFDAVCEKYNEKYGSIYKDGEGVLVDLFGIPCGTFFKCTNGLWSGVVDSDNKGNKVVGLETPVGYSEIPITKHNKDLYIIVTDFCTMTEYLNKVITIQKQYKA